MYWKTMSAAIIIVVLALITDLLGWHSNTVKILLLAVCISSVSAVAAIERKEKAAKSA